MGSRRFLDRVEAVAAPRAEVRMGWIPALAIMRVRKRDSRSDEQSAAATSQEVVPLA